MKSHINEGFELINGNPVFEGEISGWCLDSMYDIFDNSKFEDMVFICQKYDYQLYIMWILVMQLPDVLFHLEFMQR